MKLLLRLSNRHCCASPDWARQSDDRWANFQKFWAASGLVLLSLTGRIWLAPSGFADFPQVPFFEFLIAAPSRVDGWALAGMVVGMVLVLLKKFRGIGLGLFAIAISISVALSQERLQPWAYQFLVYSICMFSLSKTVAIKWIGWITISIYFFSAISKFDFQFVMTTGRDFLHVMVGGLQMNLNTWPSGLTSTFVLMIPMIELLAAFLLAFSRTRQVGLIAVTLMHSALLLILGPFGLGHHPGVLAWNGFLLGQVWFLFGSGRRPVGENERASAMLDSSKNSVDLVGWCGNAVGGFVLLFPLTMFVSCCDHWIAWEVYAPRSSRARLEFATEECGKLPAPLQPFLVQSTQGNGWREFDLDRWSLASQGVPIYPEDRFQFAIAADLVRRFQFQRARVSVGDVSDRWTGVRSWQVVDRPAELDRVASQFRLNTRCRRVE